MMAHTQTPITVVAATNDPVVPVEDFYPLCGLTSNLQVHLQPYGGHVGFVDILPFRLWACEATLTILEQEHVKSTNNIPFTEDAV